MEGGDGVTISNPSDPGVDQILLTRCWKQLLGESLQFLRHGRLIATFRKPTIARCKQGGSIAQNLGQLVSQNPG
jgi:hypothetical protein